MILIIRKDYQGGGLSFKAGQQIETTRELGSQLLASGHAEEIKPMMLDRDAFNKLMEAVHKQSVIRDDEEE